MGAALCFEEENPQQSFQLDDGTILFRLLAVRFNLSQSEEYLWGAEVRIQQ